MNLVAQKVTKAIFNPKRLKYKEELIPLEYEVEGFGTIQRVPVQFKNSRKQTIVGSMYRHDKCTLNCPCVIYLHSYGSNQLEGRCLSTYFVTEGIYLFCFDFPGCGLSEGENVSFGTEANQDIVDVICFIRDNFNARKICIWGRSMGAAIALDAAMMGITSIIADSSYYSLDELIRGLAQAHGIKEKKISKIMTDIQKAIQKKGSCDLKHVVPNEILREMHIPICLIHSLDDQFIFYSHSQKIFEFLDPQCSKFLTTRGPHNASRSYNTIITAVEFILHSLGIEYSYERNEEEEYFEETQLNTEVVDISEILNEIE